MTDIVELGLGPVGIAFFTWYYYGAKHINIQLPGVLAYSAPLISTLLLVVAGEADLSWALTLAYLEKMAGSAIAGIRQKTLICT